MKRTLIAASLLAASSLAHAADAKISDDVVKLGLMTDLSGVYLDYAGKGSVEAAKMAIEDFGGKVLGKPVELVTADHQNKADIGSAKAREWLDRDGVDAIVDLPNSSVALANFNLEMIIGVQLLSECKQVIFPSVALKCHGYF